MTLFVIRGYIPATPAKSGVGIGLPGYYSTHTALSGFFYALSTATFAIYGGLCEGFLGSAGFE
ncbi:hypothetical protein ELU49_11285 [Salmonella enterica]|nr:hypothetical protein [Salmonella enterica]